MLMVLFLFVHSLTFFYSLIPSFIRLLVLYVVLYIYLGEKTIEKKFTL